MAGFAEHGLRYFSGNLASRRAMNRRGFRIVSGGQTGVDRAALDWAIENRIPHAGWCPRGRLAEDGPIPRRYKLRETPSSAFSQRTRWNVRDSDGTVIISNAKELAGGSELTRRAALRLRKPFLHLWGRRRNPAGKLREFLASNNIKILNVAGPRASEAPGLRDFVMKVLDEGLGGRVGKVESGRRLPQSMTLARRC